jgi:hypothetical protein
MSERTQRILQGILLLGGIMLILAPSYQMLPANIGYFLSVSCFVAIWVIDYYF